MLNANFDRNFYHVSHPTVESEVLVKAIDLSLILCVLLFLSQFQSQR